MTKRKPNKSKPMSCAGCGCTDLHACDGGCFWVAPRVCSRCMIIVSDVLAALVGIAMAQTLKKIPNLRLGK